MITIIFIVNGVDVHIEADGNQPLSVARNLALTESNNTGRPMDEWEVHNDEGVLLDPLKTPIELNIQNADRLFLNLSVGCGGHN